MINFKAGKDLSSIGLMAAYMDTWSELRSDIYERRGPTRHYGNDQIAIAFQTMPNTGKVTHCISGSNDIAVARLEEMVLVGFPAKTMIKHLTKVCGW